MNAERRIRDAMREMVFYGKCPSCGSEAISTDKKKDTDVGIMDEMVCADCDHSFTAVSSVHTFSVEN